MTSNATKPGIHVGSSFFDVSMMRDAPAFSIPALSPDAIAALTFCHQWLSGQQTFELTTSGSTGLPKPVTIPRERIITSVRMTASAVGLQPSYHALVCLSPRFIAGIMMLARGLILGMEMTFVEPSGNPFDTLEGAFDFTALVPMQLRQALDSASGRSHLDRMKVVLVGGAPLPSSLEARIRELSCDVYHTFGMTETLSHIALRHLRMDEEKQVYSALSGVELSLDDRGCLVVRSPLTEGPVVTNDMVELLSENQFRWLGRIDDVIITGGIKISAAYVEDTIEEALRRLTSGDHYKAVVLGIPDEKTGQRIVACIEGPQLSGKISGQLQASIRSALGNYSSPREFRFIEKIPRLESGKVDRTTLKALVTTRR